MSTRNEIQDGSHFDRLTRGIVYTEVLGWIDMGHARGDDIATLKRQFMHGERSGIGSHKNKGFRPIIFPDPDDACVRHQPWLANLPHFMTWIRPWNDFSSGVVNVLTSNGTSIEFKGAR